MFRSRFREAGLRLILVAGVLSACGGEEESVPTRGAQSSRDPGGTCVGDNECAPDFCIGYDTPNGLVQKCLPPQGDGGPCSGPEHCQPGLNCVSYDSPNGRVRVCSAPQGEMGRCSSPEECQAGLTCVTELGRCLALKGQGEYCNNLSIRCAEGLTCLENECLSSTSPKVVGPGERCDNEFKICPAGLRCDYDEANQLRCTKSAEQ